MALFRIGIDVGGSKIESVVLGPAGEELYRRRIASPAQAGYGAMLSAIVHSINDARSHLPEGGRWTTGIGIPGSINQLTGLVQNANSTCLIGHPLQHDLESLLARPVAVDNDANCFTMAESRAGAGKGGGLVFGVIMGTGCGGGICIDGHVRQGPHRIAGEWGHFSVDPNGSSCYCGNRGCVETKISGSGVERSFLEEFGEAFTMDRIVAGYRSGEPRCRVTFLRFLDDFGRCLAGVISVLDPDAVVLGGGLSNIDELYTDGADLVRRYAFHADLRTPVLKNQLGDSSGVMGAAWIGV